jgi:rfaE bifunctional protein kinase chain/domain
MDAQGFKSLTERYGPLRIGVVGDFCLDRYLEIDPSRQETSIETGLPVHNVVNVRAQPGGAGTILNNLSALGIGMIYPVGFCGEDGEGFELMRALERTPGVRMDYFLRTDQRRTFTYCKPLVVAPGKPPDELNRLDSKNWTPTPSDVQDALIGRVAEIGKSVDALIVLDQTDIPQTGVVTGKLLDALKRTADVRPELPILADSRRGLSNFPPFIYKMNLAELQRFRGIEGDLNLDQVRLAASKVATANKKTVFVTMAENGILGALPEDGTEHVRCLPIRGQIDVVGAGDAVSANLCAALAAGAALRETLEIANAAASVVIHKLGTTGTASLQEISDLIGTARHNE